MTEGWADIGELTAFVGGRILLLKKIVGEFEKTGLIYNDGGCIIVGELQKSKSFYNYSYKIWDIGV